MFNTKEYWEMRLQSRFDLVGVGDISLSMNYNKWSYKVTRKILKKLIVKYAGKVSHDKALDIGSGTGFIVDILQSCGKKVTGVDISPTVVKNLKKLYPGADFLEFDVGKEEIPLAECSFNICTAASVLYHIVDDEALHTALRNIHHLLKKDGIFIFSDNFIHNREFNIAHQKCRTLAEYEVALKRNGFKILDRVPNYVLMNDPVDAKTKFFPRIWNTVTDLSRRSKAFDQVIWPLIYPIELVLTSILKESPAQEFMICQKVE